AAGFSTPESAATRPRHSRIGCRRRRGGESEAESCKEGSLLLLLGNERVMKRSRTPVDAKRLASIDAYRGLVMFLMMAEVLRISEVARAFPGNAIWRLLSCNSSHDDWVGCSLHHLIQHSFSF